MDEYRTCGRNACVRLRRRGPRGPPRWRPRQSGKMASAFSARWVKTGPMPRFWRMSSSRRCIRRNPAGVYRPSRTSATFRELHREEAVFKRYGGFFGAATRMRNADDDFAFDDLAAAVVIKWKGQDVSWAGDIHELPVHLAHLFVVDQGKGQGLQMTIQKRMHFAQVLSQMGANCLRCARELQCASGTSVQSAPSESKQR